MTRSLDVIECTATLTGRALLESLHSEPKADFILLRRTGVTVSDAVVDRLFEACAAPIAVSASPVPCAAARPGHVHEITVHDQLPPAPTLALACAEVCLVASSAVRSIEPPIVSDADGWRVAWARLSQRLTDAGWRHVAAPGTAMNWAPTPLPPDAQTAAWSDAAVGELDGPSNEGLATHARWADIQLRGVRVIVDGACLTDQPHNGSQALVAEITRALKRVRPDAAVTLAVPGPFAAHTGALLGGDGVEVMARSARPTGFDLVYRPYQLIDPGELPWVAETDARLLIGQLDTIAFANPSYHPSSALFHEVRNLQRHEMRIADGVAFISEFGRQVALAECPDLELARTHVVSCGADPEPAPSGFPQAELADLDDFVLCLSATFWHKNRTHAIRVFERLCRDHGYRGSLVIAGPQPYYGSSAEAEDRLLESFDRDVSSRVLRPGQVDETTKWWLLRNARAVIYPSVVEGFGLVPFEAASVGTPTLTHAGSALQEVLAGTPGLIPTWDEDVWARAVAAVVSSDDERRRIVAAIVAVAQHHTWADVAVRTWEAIDATLAMPRRSRLHEEGGALSRVAPAQRALARRTAGTHMISRVAAAVRRRVRTEV